LSPSTRFLQGHITVDIIRSTVAPNRELGDEFVLICGPDGFSTLSQTLITQNFDYPPERIHVF